MTTVMLLLDQPVEVAGKGIVFLKSKETYPDLPEPVISSLLGRGMAVIVTVYDGVVVTRADLEKKTTPELRKIARERKMESVNILTRPILLDALAPVTESVE